MDIRYKITEFVHSIDSTIDVGISYDQFYCYPEESYVNICLESSKAGDEFICDFVKRRFGIDINPFLLGILHEIGHIMTYDDTLDEERSIIYYMLQLNFKEERMKEYSDMYFSIPSEFEATSWAIDYYLSNKDYCDNFIKEIGYETY